MNLIQIPKITGFSEPCLDPGGLGGYLHRLAMVGSPGHNRTSQTPTTLGMNADCPPDVWSVESHAPNYPAALSLLAVPPARLWVDGRLPGIEAGAMVGIVGSRSVSQKGCVRVAQMAAELTLASCVVVSGGALGMDAAAHRGALESGGPTWAVLGAGIDVTYPDRHKGLFDQIRAHGGLLSEYGPGTPPRPWQFPARNRVVAALSRALVLGESRRGSGALITARLAAALGKPVYAIPGSPGTDELLLTGAALPVESARDVLARLAGETVARSAPAPAEWDELMILLREEAQGAEVLARRLGLSLTRMLGMLCEAELAGVVCRAPGGKFEVNRGD